LAQHLWKPPKLKISRELLEQIQAESLKPADVEVVAAVEPKPIVVVKKAVEKRPAPRPIEYVYQPQAPVDNSWALFIKSLDLIYLQSAENRLKYQQIRDKAQEELDEERDIEFLLMMH
jgi:hypothetical protein